MPDTSSPAAQPAQRLTRFRINLWVTLAAFVLFAALFAGYVVSEKRIDRANELRLRSYLLADELRQSSDDLTRMVRTYVITGNPVYKRRYQEILAIRDGLKPRPRDYNNIYWDLVLEDDVRPRPAGQAVPLLTLMRQAGFSHAELAKLGQAKANSDALTSTEYAAMLLVESEPVTEAKRMEASLMLHNAAYHRAKADIMQPISEFNQMMERRTLQAVRDAEATATLLRVIFLVSGVLLLITLRRTYRALHATLGGSVDTLYAHFARIGSGDFSQTVEVAQGRENSILGWLAETQNKLSAIDAARTAAEAKNQRLSQLYAVLGECNQAIVHAASEAELLPQICRDTVLHGGMKMAWIGMVDPATWRLNPVAMYGEGTEYLYGLQIYVDADSPAGQGPSGQAFREDRPYWCDNFQQDPATAVWHEAGALFGWQASVALPLHRNGKVVGTFNLYTDATRAFDETERTLLLELASDVDYAIDRFARAAEHAQLREQLQQSEESSRLVLENSLDAVINMDDQGRVIEWSGAAGRMFGYQRDEALGQMLDALIIPPGQRAAHRHGMARLLQSGQPHMIGRIVEVMAMRRDGSEFPAELSVASIQRGPSVFFSAFIRDISQRKEAETRIQHLAHFDALTGLPNRTLLNDHLKCALGLARRSNGHLAVMFLDLDHFKDINDTLGHSVGDALLIELSRRLDTVLREEDTISRLGGDEFILMLPGTDARGAEHVAQKLLDQIAEPCRIDPYELTVTGSIGIALYPEDGEDLETLSRNADAAMYQAKQAGRNGFRFFTAELQARSAHNLQLVTALRHALERQQLQVHYQPQHSLHTDRIIGVEALLRWQHPELGAVSPAEFIPIAEDSGLILPIGEWVLRQAAQQARAWLDAGLEPLAMAVNLSAIQFRHPDLPDLVTRILDEVGLPPHYLELELTEGVAMYDPQAAIAVMDRLHERGVRLSIDDFGTGYSSLSYLKKFKAYKLKIDQTFVRDISTDPEDKAIVSAIIHMARSLGLKTIAEGVETPAQLEFLREQGCDEVQGYLVSRPLPAESCAALLAGNSPIPA